MAEDLATAYHEAGHAVAAVILGFEFDNATIERKGDRLGKVSAPNPLLGIAEDSPEYAQQCGEGIVWF
jgi:hypothetical protein